jgi:hypothetical protein
LFLELAVLEKENMSLQAQLMDNGKQKQMNWKRLYNVRNIFFVFKKEIYKNKDLFFLVMCDILNSLVGHEHE